MILRKGYFLTRVFLTCKMSVQNQFLQNQSPVLSISWVFSEYSPPRYCQLLPFSNVICCWYLVPCGIHGQVIPALLGLFQNPFSLPTRGFSAPCKTAGEKINVCLRRLSRTQTQMDRTLLWSGQAYQRQNEEMNGTYHPASYHLPLTQAMLQIPPSSPPQTCWLSCRAPSLGPRMMARESKVESAWYWVPWETASHLEIPQQPFLTGEEGEAFVRNFCRPVLAPRSHRRLMQGAHLPSSSPKSRSADYHLFHL